MRSTPHRHSTRPRTEQGTAPTQPCVLTATGPRIPRPPSARNHSPSGTRPLQRNPYRAHNFVRCQATYAPTASATLNSTPPPKGALCHESSDAKIRHRLPRLVQAPQPPRPHQLHPRTALIAFAGAARHRISHVLELVFLGPIILCSLILSPLLIILLYRWVTRRFLWKVRNRLILTYALMSLAPVVLCLMLFAIASYLLRQASSPPTAPSRCSTTPPPSSATETHAASPCSPPPAARATMRLRPGRPGEPSTHLARHSQGQYLPAPNAPSPADPFVGQSLPSWLHPGFHGVVAFKDHLYLCAFVAIPQATRTLSVLGMRPLDKTTLASTDGSLGRVLLIPGFTKINSSGGGGKINVNINPDAIKSDGDDFIIIGDKNDLEKFDASSQEHFATVDLRPSSAADSPPPRPAHRLQRSAERHLLGDRRTRALHRRRLFAALDSLRPALLHHQRPRHRDSHHPHLRRHLLRAAGALRAPRGAASAAPSHFAPSPSSTAAPVRSTAATSTTAHRHQAQRPAWRARAIFNGMTPPSSISSPSSAKKSMLSSSPSPARSG